MVWSLLSLLRLERQQKDLLKWKTIPTYYNVHLNLYNYDPAKKSQKNWTMSGAYQIWWAPDYVKNSFAFTGVKLWNSLPSSLTEDTFLNEKNSKLRSGRTLRIEKFLESVKVWQLINSVTECVTVEREALLWSRSQALRSFPNLESSRPTPGRAAILYRFRPFEKLQSTRNPCHPLAFFKAFW